ncbi:MULTISPECIES: NAD(P)(+) transhydrogenase (Re/Si-specific) subunit beta [unclassified Crossiella]|uniref:NAD(P)(+) transhydrogenase (Re/Si-specific) subunit beta n=1 Tax=unclassified Crossiella TaxID=2620835 RepID=UPI001FFE6BF3|nr:MULTISPECIES: NAD(P)(+) transhydrogenase (Re/Si-specific) subunit beta [unclassified Crossiella]MCK2242878.1 NAD(P)(+) transhydrogenase (Re/Si-specific) subunit beta [Crossiella sp. S99.2]MCK2256755.1 NAD(P)(+) transhydrogenase (Re/Si-specific) subunit beta [Crossiella sp. S99.1]
MSQDLVHLVYLLAALCFILALKGLSTPRHARAANLVGALGMVFAVAIAFGDGRIGNVGWILAAIALGVVIGIPAARAVKMTAIPQMVALFNGVGGAAAALVALTEFLATTGNAGMRAATVFGVLVGCVSFSGSLVTFLKLQELMTTRPVILPYGRSTAIGVSVLCLGLAIAVVPTASTALVLALTVAGLLLGVLFVLPVGGADVPIAISLLNAFTGLAVAASGYVLGNTLLIVAGTLVGASGTLLTRMMAKAMGRSLTNILFGAFTPAAAGGGGPAESRTVRTGTPEDIAIMLGYARTVVVIPGYGLAVAQAQHVVRELADLLAGRGVEVAYGIHPVAGRMPGHMNVLLAEADVPYAQLKEMEEVNPRLASTDVALVIGANDVVNPAARDQPDSPIYGMPILDVDKADSVVFLKRSMRPGFAGIENELLFNPRTTLLFGDAKDSLSSLVTAVKQLA